MEGVSRQKVLLQTHGFLCALTSIYIYAQCCIDYITYIYTIYVYVMHGKFLTYNSLHQLTLQYMT